MLGELIDLISGIGFDTEESKADDTLGRVYEYFGSSTFPVESIEFPRI